MQTPDDWRLPAERCYWVLPGLFLAGAWPPAPKPQGRLTDLWDVGMRTFVNLMEEGEKNVLGEPYGDYGQQLKGLAERDSQFADQLRFPIRDLSVPSMTEMEAILNAIDVSLSANRPVYLHCLGGIGRTGTVVCCWLMIHGLTRLEDVVQRLGELRKQDRQMSGRAAPQSAAQFKFLDEFASQMREAPPLPGQ